MTPKQELAMIRALVRPPYPEPKQLDRKAALASAVDKSPAGLPMVKAWTFYNGKPRESWFTKTLAGDKNDPAKLKWYATELEATTAYRNDLASRIGTLLLALDVRIYTLENQPETPNVE